MPKPITQRPFPAFLARVSAVLQWTHDATTCPTGERCLGSTDCSAFPTTQDRITHVRRAFEAYAEADGTAFDDFLLDVALLTLADCSRPSERWRTAMRAARREVLRGAQ